MIKALENVEIVKSPLPREGLFPLCGDHNHVPGTSLISSN